MKSSNLRSNILAQFTTHAVGHGLFYTGIFRDLRSSRKLSFVYDCGSTNQSALKREVQDFRNKIDGSLEILVLSHLHEDHCDGLNELVNDGLNVDYVFMPYLNNIARTVIIATCTFQEEWFIDFLIDPVQYFLGGEHPRARQVIFISRSADQGLEPTGGPNEEIPGDEFPTLNDDSLTLDNDEETQRDAVGGMPEWQKYVNSGSLSFATARSYVNAGSWLFKFFSVLPDKDKLCKFYNDVQKSFPNLNVKCFKNPDERRKLRSLYKQLSSSKPLRGDINSTSLVMMERRVGRVGPKLHHWICGIRGRSEILKQVGSTEVGCLLLGDISLKADGIVSNIAVHFRNDLRKISSLVVPHHGSSRNWNSDIVMISSAETFIISEANNRLGRLCDLYFDLDFWFEKTPMFSDEKHEVRETFIF